MWCSSKGRAYLISYNCQFEPNVGITMTHPPGTSSSCVSAIRNRFPFVGQILCEERSRVVHMCISECL